MDEPILKRKNLINRILNNQVFMTAMSFVLMVFVIIGSSYAIFSRDDEILDSVVIKTGDLEAVIRSSEESIILNYETLGVSDTEGLAKDAYSFTVKNTGDLPIEYYEIRIVNKEYTMTTLPHKFIHFTIQKNDLEYSDIFNLADNKDYIYLGGSLAPSEEDTFNLKLWVSEYGDLLMNKVADLSLELLLYSDIPTRNYIVYDLNGGQGVILKTNVLSHRITKTIPKKDGFEFLGWGESIDGEVLYKSGDIYNLDTGMMLYAIWKEEITY